jgi:hypothetical protein
MGRSGRRGLAVIEGKGRGRCRDSILLLTGDGEAARQRSLTAAIGVHRSGEGREEEASWWPKWMRGGAVKVWALLYSPGMVRRADSCSNCAGHGVRCNCFKSFSFGRVNEGEIFD